MARFLTLKVENNHVTILPGNYYGAPPQHSQWKPWRAAATAARGSEHGWMRQSTSAEIWPQVEKSSFSTRAARSEEQNDANILENGAIRERVAKLEDGVASMNAGIDSKINSFLTKMAAYEVPKQIDMKFQLMREVEMKFDEKLKDIDTRFQALREMDMKFDKTFETVEKLVLQRKTDTNAGFDERVEHVEKMVKEASVKVDAKLDEKFKEATELTSRKLDKHSAEMDEYARMAGDMEKKLVLLSNEMGYYAKVASDTETMVTKLPKLFQVVHEHMEQLAEIMDNEKLTGITHGFYDALCEFPEADIVNESDLDIRGSQKLVVEAHNVGVSDNCKKKKRLD
eukprot:TRINITY_DN42159_c0_g1_i1.p1 TRINITY_DN42159_c0_g1~~TRINITY_DN42159_c0_g1_i1.p1  ORF type:complete len:341 (+),score=79.79 TRINITY_DN42159_c0_g1_i1:53-1075(+)